MAEKAVSFGRETDERALASLPSGGLWVPKGQSVEIHGRGIDCGMFYIGKTRDMAAGFFAHADMGPADNLALCCVDPSLEIAESGAWRAPRSR